MHNKLRCLRHYLTLRARSTARRRPFHSAPSRCLIASSQSCKPGSPFVVPQLFFCDMQTGYEVQGAYLTARKSQCKDITVLEDFGKPCIYKV